MLIPGYQGVDLYEVWRVVTSFIPVFKCEIERLDELCLN